MSKKNAPKIDVSDVLPIFPSLIWKTQFKQEVFQTINQDILKKLKDMTQSMPKLTTGRSWQSEQGLHQLLEFAGLVDCINPVTNSILEFLKIRYNTFEITACWANINARGASHKIHSHPNNFLSGVYYARICEGADTINFHDPRIQTGIIRAPVKALTAENTDQVVVRVKEGMLLIFPSWLQHSVNSNQSNSERISVSFNIMFSSYTETMSKPLW